MDRLLNRGAYDIDTLTDQQPGLREYKKRFGFQRIVGIDEHFSRSDRWVTCGIFLWSLFWFVVFLAGSMVYLIHPWSNQAWADYWLWTGIYLPLVIAVVTTIWFTIGCSSGLRLFFNRLSRETSDPKDDGSVQHGHSTAPKEQYLTNGVTCQPAPVLQALSIDISSCASTIERHREPQRPRQRLSNPPARR